MSTVFQAENSRKTVRFVCGVCTVASCLFWTGVAQSAQIPASAFLTYHAAALPEQTSPILVESVPEPEPGPKPRPRYESMGNQGDSDKSRGRSTWCRHGSSRRDAPAAMYELGLLWEGLWTFEIPNTQKYVKRGKHHARCR